MEKEELKQECIKRLKILKLDSKVITDFEQDNKVYLTKIKQDGIQLITNDNVAKLIEQLEENRRIKIYHIINIENKFYILCIHGEKTAWKSERVHLKRGFVGVLKGVLKSDEFGDYEVKDIGVDIENGKIKKVIEWKTT